MIDNIPKKSHFRLNEVCGMTGIKPYVLRFWETEFTGLAPMLSGEGQKLYRRYDVELIFKIKEFLFDKKMTIEQAKLHLAEETKADEEEADLSEAIDSLHWILKKTENLKGQHAWS